MAPSEMRNPDAARQKSPLAAKQSTRSRASELLSRQERKHGRDTRTGVSTTDAPATSPPSCAVHRRPRPTGLSGQRPNQKVRPDGGKCPDAPLVQSAPGASVPPGGKVLPTYPRKNEDSHARSENTQPHSTGMQIELNRKTPNSNFHAKKVWRRVAFSDVPTGKTAQGKSHATRGNRLWNFQPALTTNPSRSTEPDKFFAAHNKSGGRPEEHVLKHAAPRRKYRRSMQPRKGSGKGALLITGAIYGN